MAAKNKVTKKSITKKSTTSTKKVAKALSKPKKSKASKSAVSSPKLNDYSANATPVISPSGPSELDKVLEQIPDDQKEKLQVIKKSVESFRDQIVPRLQGYVMGISLLPPSKEDKDKEKINVLVLIDNKEAKSSQEQLQEKVQKICDDMAKLIDPNLAPQILLLSDLWQQCFDSKHDVLQMIAMSAIVYDTGMLAAVKISEVHKSMVLKKFEKYIVSYVLGGSIVQGRATPESDVDVFVIIDDTDVKKMTRVELRDKLRAIIIGMGAEAGQITGIQNKINIQVYILTDFWENVKDANPVIFTFLRDGVPFYDRGVFMPWKQLLEMGRIKPSPEAIDLFMSSGAQFMDRIYVKIRDIVMEDLFWALLTPSQAALMMYGIPPTTPKETPEVMRDILVKKEKILEEKYVKTLEDVLQIRKDFEHGTKKSVSGKEMDDLVKRSDAYLKRLEKLFKEIEERKQQEQVLHMYENTITILRDVFRLEGITTVDDKDVEFLFKEHILKKGHLPEHLARSLKEILKGKKDYDAKKLTKQEVNSIMRSSRELIRLLVEHIQRKRGQELEKTRIKVKYGDKFGEVILLGDHAYVIQDLDSEDKKIMKATISKKGTLVNRLDINIEEFESALMTVEIPPKVFIKNNLFEDIKEIFGSDVEILINY